MQYSTKRRVVLGMTTGGLLISGFGMASAQAATGASAEGVADNSPGLLSGNLVSVPINLPINVCGDSINVAGLLNPASDDHCADLGGTGGASSGAEASHSPGLGSGNVITVPVSVPINLCGDTVNVLAAGNPASDDSCGAGAGAPTPPRHPGPPPTTPPCPPTPPRTPPPAPTPPAPPTTHTPPAPPRHARPATPTGNLAETGSDAALLAPIGLGVIGGGLGMRRKLSHRG